MLIVPFNFWLMYAAIAEFHQHTEKHNSNVTISDQIFIYLFLGNVIFGWILIIIGGLLGWGLARTMCGSEWKENGKLTLLKLS